MHASSLCVAPLLLIKIYRLNIMKTAVHLHLYYMNQLPLLLAKLHNLDKAQIDYDLYVTMVEPNKKAENDIYDEFPSAHIWQVENRGYDIGPFVDFLHKINFENYNYILKIHTKNQNDGPYTMLNGHFFDNCLWGKILIDALIGSPQIIKQNYKKMLKNENICMMGSQFCLTSEEHVYKNLLPQIKDELSILNMSFPSYWNFVAGSMFLAKAKILKPFLQINISDFDTTNGCIKEGTKAHVYERLFGLAVYAQNKKIMGIKQRNFSLKLLYPNIKRFFYQKKNTKSGNTLIKICKLPIWHRRNN